MDKEKQLAMARDSNGRLKGYIDRLMLERDELDKLIYEMDRDQMQLENLIKQLEYEVQHGEAQ